MYTQTILIALLAAVAEARFNQEQGNGAIAAIGALSDLGSSGQAATLSGGSIRFLLAAANPCGKLTQADLIVTQLGTSARAIAAARGLVAAEQNFNPFVVSVPSICSDPTLPKTAALRGVVPLIDPAVADSTLENANSKTSVTTPFTADGLSVAQVMANQGFSNFTAVAVDGTKSTVSSSGSVAPAGAKVSSSSPKATVAAPSSVGCVASTTMITVTRTATASAETVAATAPAVSTGSASSSSPAAGSRAVTNAVTGNFAGFQASTIAGLDFGICTPTLKFELGLDNRAATEGTFQAIDPLVNKGQEEALNPAIITNRIHDQLTNVCGANQAAKDAVAAAQTMIVALGTRDATTADAFNKALGFAGTNTNPDNAPVNGLIGHT